MRALAWVGWLSITLTACGPFVPSNSSSAKSSTTTGTAGSNPGTGASTPMGSSGGTGNIPMPGNPFAGAAMYANPDWSNHVRAAAQGANGALLQKIATVPTAVWMDSVEAIAGGAQNLGRLSLVQHLEGAVAQAKQAGKPGVITLIIYNIPNRDCAAGASAGKLMGTAGLQTYKTAYIDVIAKTLAQPDYQALRVALILEPDSLPNMVTNQSIPACAAVAAQNLYSDGITYAIQKLGVLPNAALYLDIAHAGWLGYSKNLPAAVTYYANLIKTATAGNLRMVRGFATNIANYVPLQEPYVSPANIALLNGNFYMGNPVFDELTFARQLQQGFADAGMPDMHFVLDTSRNGWTKINDGKPIDRRPVRGDWCNVADAGLGERPQASPTLWEGYDAFMWIKPPGESDGASTDASCQSSNAQLDAMANAPPAGMWFTQGLVSMAQKATPAL